MARSTRLPEKTGGPAREPFRDAEFRAMLTFNVEDGRLWLADRRMMLMDVASFASIRKHLIDTQGVEEARRFFTTLGYEAGVADAELMRRRWPDDPKRQRETPHPFLGVTQIQPVGLRHDPKTGELIEGEWLWLHCLEADAHLQTQGIGNYPACWMEAGYAIGFSTTANGRLMLFNEVTCRSMGSQACRVIGRAADHWSPDEREEILRYVDTPAIKRKPRNSRRDKGEVVLTPQATPNSRSTIVGRSPSIKAAVELLNSVADTDATVLISGESGVGKELFTRTLHSLSRRAQGPFIGVNCAAIPETLIESELFGVERGAFTGATHSRPGRFERAISGTLFLDEVGLLNPVSQAKLLRALQEGEIERVGGTKAIKVDVRVVAATNISLGEAVTEHRFRDDLFFRLNVFPIHLPPLRERRDDIPMLLQHYLERYNQRHGKSVPGFTRDALDALLHYRYPGNIRELENLVERAVILAKNAPIDRSHLFAGGEILNASLLSLNSQGKLVPHAEQSTVLGAASLDELLDNLAHRLVSAGEATDALQWSQLQTKLMDAVAQRALEQSGGQVSAAARLLGMPRHQLSYQLEKTRRR